MKSDHDKTRSTGTVHTSAKAGLTSVATLIPIRILPWSGSPPKFNHLFVGLLPTFPENFIEIRSEVFAQSKQTDKQQRLHILLRRGNHGMQLLKVGTLSDKRLNALLLYRQKVSKLQKLI